MAPTLLLSSPLCHPLITLLSLSLALPVPGESEETFPSRIDPQSSHSPALFIPPVGGVSSSELGAQSLVTTPSRVTRGKKKRGGKENDNRERCQ